MFANQSKIERISRFMTFQKIFEYSHKTKILNLFFAYSAITSRLLQFTDLILLIKDFNTERLNLAFDCKFLDLPI